MTLSIDYYFAAHSPWTYLGHARFTAMVAAAGATVRIKPVDLASVFPVTGGLPLAKRAPARQAYRLVELKRFSQSLGVPLNLQPQFFPVAPDDAGRLIIATDQALGAGVAMGLAGAVMQAVWVQERNIADPQTLAELLEERQLPAGLLATSQEAAVQSAFQGYTQEALAAGVFGAPSYVIEGELFWGQDRLDFVERRLATALPSA